ncbi:MAG: hypothetical protein C4560_13615 [Nitrospiraceae bacterium]|nr:MAG: hypothetical protein C4560_13615 [Nitrospiraceae bacterium]
MQKIQKDYNAKEDKKEIIRRMYRAAIKHYVREYGWLEAAKKRNDTLKAKRELRYFTLCSLEAIDIKTFYKAGIISRDASGFPSTFFCEWDKELTEEIARVVGSNYWSGPFEEFISKLFSNADRLLDKLKEQKLFPFDIYNLDFTGSCIPGDEPPYSKTLEALTRLVDLQHKEEFDFDMFLTFRAKRHADNEEAIGQLKSLIVDNCVKYPDAKVRLESNHSALDTLLASHYEKFIAIAIPKFLSGIAKDYRYKLKINPSFKYKRSNRDGVYYITNIILSFDYIHDRRARKKSKLNDPSITDIIQDTYYPQSILDIFNHDVVDVDRKIKEIPTLKTDLDRKVKEVQAL